MEKRWMMEDISKFLSYDFGWNLAKALALPLVPRQKLNGLKSLIQLEMKIFLGIVLEVLKPVANIENRYECTGKRRKCKIHDDNC